MLYFLCLKPILSPTMLSHRQPGADYLRNLYSAVPKPLLDGGDGPPRQVLSRMVWTLLVLSHLSLGGYSRTTSIGRQEVNAQPPINHLLQKQQSKSKAAALQQRDQTQVN